MNMSVCKNWTSILIVTEVFEYIIKREMINKMVVVNSVVIKCLFSLYVSN